MGDLQISVVDGSRLRKFIYDTHTYFNKFRTHGSQVRAYIFLRVRTIYNIILTHFFLYNITENCRIKVDILPAAFFLGGIAFQ